jgi:hypothetical protein
VNQSRVNPHFSPVQCGMTLKTRGTWNEIRYLVVRGVLTVNRQRDFGKDRDAPTFAYPREIRLEGATTRFAESTLPDALEW